jgi:hypothetical protein
MEERKKIAKWLYDKIMTEDCVYQSEVVDEISEQFGDQYTYEDENSGNFRIDSGVLREFNKLKDEDIDWDHQEKCWYKKSV